MKRHSSVLFTPALFGMGLLAGACSDSSSSSPGPADSGTSDSTTSGGDAAKEGGRSDAGASEADGGSPGDGAIEASGPEAGPSDAGRAETGATDSGGAGDVAAGVDAGTSSLTAIGGYQLGVFATGGSAYKGPDSLELDGAHVWVGYQMGVQSKDGTDAGPPYDSSIVEYNLDGTLAGKSFEISGHADGVRVDPATHLVWATSNEDGNPVVVSYDPGTGASKTYALPPMPHGGGLDDMAFIDGKMIVALSAPSPDDAGVYSAPALAQVTVNGSALAFTPILAGNANAGDITVDSGAVAPLQLTDPDSLSIDDKGQLVLVSQGDSELVFIKNPGGTDAGAQSVAKLNVGTQLDDTVWAKTATGTLLVADATANTIYAIRSNFTPGTVYTETPDDSTPIPGIVATVDLATGVLRPVVLGFKKPTGLLFVP